MREAKKNIQNCSMHTLERPKKYVCTALKHSSKPKYQKWNYTLTHNLMFLFALSLSLLSLPLSFSLSVFSSFFLLFHSSFFIRLFIMFYCCFSWTYVFCVVNIDARVPLCHCVLLISSPVPFHVCALSFLLLQIFYKHSNRIFICIRRFNEYIFLDARTLGHSAHSDSCSFFLNSSLYRTF